MASTATLAPSQGLMLFVVELDHVGNIAERQLLVEAILMCGMAGLRYLSARVFLS